MPDPNGASKGQIGTSALLDKREEVATKLYESQPLTPLHHQFEEQFNAVERELFVRNGGKSADYKYKHDMRHCFAFSEVRDARGLLEQTAGMRALPGGKGHYVLRPVNEVINWRDTKIGQTRDAALRRSIGKEKLDDTGHLIALDFGADPAERRNVAAQNCVQNEWGSWYRQEVGLKRKLESHSACRLRVTVWYTADRFNRRSYGWHMDASGVDRKGRPVIFNGNIIHFNPVVHAATRKIAHANAVETRERARNVRYTGPPELRLL